MSDDDRLLFDVSPRPTFVFDRETLALVEVNHACCALYGWSRAELLAMTLRDLRQPDQSPSLDFALARERQHTNTAFSRTSRHATKTGRVIDVEVEMVRITYRGRACTLASVTELTGAAEVERRFRMLVEHSADGIHTIDEHGRFTYLSPGVERILGVRTGELVGERVDELAGLLRDPDDGTPRLGPKPGETVVNIARVRHRSGAWRWTESTTTNLLLDPGIRALVTNVRDITDRRSAETLLRSSEANFRALIERLPIVTVVHRDGQIIYVNPACIDQLGYLRAEDLVGRPILELIASEDHEAVARMSRDDRTGTIECRMIRRDGGIAIVESDGVLLDFDGAPAHLVIGRDITERRELFARVAMADRMLALGTLAAGVAHEINNPLAYVMANLELLAREMPALLSDQHLAGTPYKRHQFVSFVADAREGAERVSTIVRDLNALTRPANDACGPVDVVAILASSLKMANNELRHRARVVQNYAADLPHVAANGSRLGQVFLNLLVNAAHAFGDRQLDLNEVRVRATSAAGTVVVEIEDNGVGMSPEIVGRIFDPFFTTKPVGVGIGLGLAISHQIVQSIGGEIFVTSAVGRGTTVRVVLRASDAHAPAPVAKPAITRRPRRILVIDDEASVGRAVSALLSMEHEVVSTTHPRAALDRLAAGESFDVILCDLMMPEMSGMEFAEQVARLAPGHHERIVFVTGGAFTEHARGFLAATKRATLDKPFSEEQLRRAIDSVG